MYKREGRRQERCMNFWVWLSKYPFHGQSDGVLGSLVVLGISLCCGHSDQSIWPVPALPADAAPPRRDLAVSREPCLESPGKDFSSTRSPCPSAFCPSVVLSQTSVEREASKIPLQEYLCISSFLCTISEKYVY